MIAFELAIVSAFLYRRGGTSAGTLWRDLGVPCCMLAYFFMSDKLDWSLFWCFGLLFAAQTTYFKRPGWDAHWFNWLYCGLAFSFAMLPYAWATGHWMGFLWRTLIVTGFTVAWSELIGWDDLEEGGRGFTQIITLSLLVFP